MTLEVDVEHRLGAFGLSARFVAASGVTALFGRSGSGKTSLVNVVAGLIRPDRGHVRLDGETLVDRAAGLFVPPHRRRIGYVFQEARLFPHLSVRGNLLYGRRFAGAGGDGREFDQIVSLLGLGGLIGRATALLSGGEKQRVAIGRALLCRPRLLLMDEPLASLDAERKAEIMPWLERLRDEAGVPIVYVGHSIAEIARLATTVVLMADGRCVAAGQPGEVLGRHASLPATGAGEAVSVIDARVATHDAAFGLTTLDGAGGTLTVPLLSRPPGTPMRVVIRASDVFLADHRPTGISALNILAGRVVELANETNAIVDVGIDCGGQRLLARVTRKSAAALGIAVGKPVHAIVKSVALDDGDGR